LTETLINSNLSLHLSNPAHTQDREAAEIYRRKYVVELLSSMHGGATAPVGSETAGLALGIALKYYALMGRSSLGQLQRQQVDAHLPMHQWLLTLA
jgi:hypothetical protein